MKIIFVLLLSTFSLQSFAQNNPKKNMHLDLYWQIYFSKYHFKGNPYAAFQKELPNSAILSRNEINQDGYSGSRGTGTSTLVSFGIGIPIHIFKTSKFYNSLRIGYDGLGDFDFGAGTYGEKLVRIDSTYYPQYNASLMKDSVYFEHSGALVTGKVHQIKADLLFRFRPEKQLTFHSGLGLGLALTSNRKVEVSQRKGNYVQVTSSIIDSNYNYGNNSNYYSPFYPEQPGDEVASEYYTLKTVYSLYSYIPFGIDWEMSKKDNLFGKFHLYTEGQIGARFSDVYLNTKQTNFYFSTQIGVRFTL
jgi:hypothetical protein